MTDSRARSGHGHRYQSPIATQDGRQLNGDSYGNYYAGDVHNYGSGLDPLDRLSFAEQAAFNSSGKQFDPLCLKDTRVEVLAEIRAWVHNVEDEKCVFWLSGMAGTGKSTIARTIARELHDSGHLAASFFFSRGDADVGNAGLFVTTIERQLAFSRHLIVDRAQVLQPSIRKAVSDYPDIVYETRQDQWKVLITGPISQIDSRVGILELPKRTILSRPTSQSLVILVDALDECEDENDIKSILQLLTQSRHLTATRLCVIVTSRPDTPINLGFNTVPAIVHKQLVLDDLSTNTVNTDIGAFFNHNFDEIRTKQGVLPADWPGEETVNILVQRANALFIYAATVCRFLMEDEMVVEERLTIVLQHDGTYQASMSPIDEIYVKILQRAIPSDCKQDVKEKFQRLFDSIVKPVVTLLQPLPAISIGCLMDAKKEDVIGALRNLRSVLHISTDQGSTIRTLHPSFRDFLIDARRCIDSRFATDEGHVHYDLFMNCFRVMAAELKQDICGLQHPGAESSQLDKQILDGNAPLHLQYACRHWVAHLLRSGRILKEGTRVIMFFEKHLLHWLEVLAWMGRVTEAIRMMTELKDSAIGQNPTAQEMISDARRFILRYKLIIEKAPLQIYASGILFSPKRSRVRRTHSECIPGWIIVSPGVGDGWSECFQTLEGHSESVRAVAFSPDGKLLASASEDRTVRLWDAASGQAMSVLGGHMGKVNAVAFSPDGNLIASALSDKTVRLWDAASGQARSTIEGHTDWVTAVTFSPDGKLVASASKDKTVRLWDVACGQARSNLEGHAAWVTAVTFSSDGKLVASASDDRTVRLWDVPSSQARSTLEGHTDWVTAVAFSPDGKLVASASLDKTVRLWDVASGQALSTLEGHTDRVTAVAFSPDGKLMVSVSKNPFLKVWDPQQRARTRTVRVSGDGSLLSFLVPHLILSQLAFHKLTPAATPVSMSSSSALSPICIRDDWVLWRSRKLLWLPPDLRPSCFAVSEATVVIGDASGNVNFLTFNEVEMRWK